MSKYYKIEGGNGYCGCNFEEFYIDEKGDMSLEEINEIAAELAETNAENYDYLATGNMCEDDFDSLEDYELALEDELEWYWYGVFYCVREITKEEYEKEN